MNTQQITNWLEQRGHYFDYANEYGEPGYSTDKPILFANWNDIPKSRQEVIEKYFELEWSDEWATDSDGRAFRTQPDSYSWQPSYLYFDGEIVGWDRVDIEDVIEKFGNDPHNAVVADYDLSSRCTRLDGDFENGFHPGQTDNPADILANLPDGVYIFKIDSTGQFDISFSVWKVNEED